MGISIGGNEIVDVRYGADSISEIYQGSSLIWSNSPYWAWEDDFDYPFNENTWMDLTGNYFVGPDSYMRANGRGQVYREPPTGPSKLGWFSTVKSLPSEKVAVEGTFVKPASYNSTIDGLAGWIGLVNENTTDDLHQFLGVRINKDQYLISWKGATGSTVNANTSKVAVQGDVVKVSKTDATWSVKVNNKTIYSAPVPTDFVGFIARGVMCSTAYNPGGIFGKYHGTVEWDSIKLGSIGGPPQRRVVIKTTRDTGGTGLVKGSEAGDTAMIGSWGKTGKSDGVIFPFPTVCTWRTGTLAPPYTSWNPGEVIPAGQITTYYPESSSPGVGSVAYTSV